MEKMKMSSDATRAAARLLAEKHGLDSQAVLAALDADRDLPPELQSVLAGLGGALTAVAATARNSDDQEPVNIDHDVSQK